MSSAHSSAPITTTPLPPPPPSVVVVVVVVAVILAVVAVVGRKSPARRRKSDDAQGRDKQWRDGGPMAMLRWSLRWSSRDAVAPTRRCVPRRATRPARTPAGSRAPRGVPPLRRLRRRRRQAMTTIQTLKMTWTLRRCPLSALHRKDQRQFAPPSSSERDGGQNVLVLQSSSAAVWSPLPSSAPRPRRGVPDPLRTVPRHRRSVCVALSRGVISSSSSPIPVSFGGLAARRHLLVPSSSLRLPPEPWYASRATSAVRRPPLAPLVVTPVRVGGEDDAPPFAEQQQHDRVRVEGRQRLETER